MKFWGRIALLIGLALFLGSANFAADEKPSDRAGAAAAPDAAPAKAAADANAANAEVGKDAPTNSADKAAGANITGASAPLPEIAASAPSAATSPNPAPRAASSEEGEASQENPRFLPMAAWDGNPGLFTLETGEILPKGGFDFTAGTNKISRMPGSITVLQTGPAVAVGVNRWLSLFLQVNADEHIHVDVPSNLSLNPAGNTGLQFRNTIYSSILPATGFPPAYVEDFPFASVNGGGVGEVDLGFKLGLLSERRGNRISLSIRNDFYIPTKRGLANLLDDEVQSGQFNYGIGVEASKNIKHSIVATLNFAYRFTRQGNFNVATAGGTQMEILKQSDQVSGGFGLLMFPDKRFNIITEYDGLVFVRKGIPNTSFGSRDPAESVTGLRLYLWRGVAIDVGYRYSLSLAQDLDRNGFIAKLDIAHWPRRAVHVAAGYDTLAATCALDTPSVPAGGLVQATVNATDSLNYPLTYFWSATAGRIDGNGPFARWDSTGVAPGAYTITVRVDDGAGKNTTCSQPVTVR